MFATLLETKAKRERRGWGTAVSVAAHAAVVLLLVVVTRVDARPRPARGPVEKPPIWTNLDDRRPAGGGHGGGSRRAIEDGLPAAPSTPPGMDVDIATSVDPTFPFRGDSGILGDIARGGGGEPGTSAGAAPGIASELTVDERVGVVSERTPRYPEALRATGITGVVTVRFVVDTAGRAELRSVEVLASPNAQFTDAVLDALRGTRFTPGRVRGRAVPTLVQRAFRFELEGAGRP